MKAWTKLCAGLAMGALMSVSYAAAGCGACRATPAKAEAKAEAKAAAPGEVVYITKDQLLEMRTAHQDLLVIDVLGEGSYAKNHVEGAVNIPLGNFAKELSDGIFKDMPKDRPIVTYCANKRCKASTRAAEMLLKQGFTKVFDYENGIAEWVSLGLPVGKVK